MEKGKLDLVTVLGHTAAGKTAFAAQLANRIGGEIISADSRQVYRGMDIGTGKDYEDYLVGGKRIPSHLLDILDAGYEYNVYLFKQDFQRVYIDIKDRNIIPVLCGGSGLYIESVLRDYQMLQVPINPELRGELEKKSDQELVEIIRLYGPLHNVTDTVIRKRMIRAIEIAMFQASRMGGPVDEQELNYTSTIPAASSGISEHNKNKHLIDDSSRQAARRINPLVLGIEYERLIRRNRITGRLKMRLENGLVEEVEGLLQQGISADKMDYYGLEYRYVTRYILKEYTYDEMFGRLNTVSALRILSSSTSSVGSAEAEKKRIR